MAIAIESTVRNWLEMHSGVWKMVWQGRRKVPITASNFCNLIHVPMKPLHYSL